jgi:hypothetical protein
MPAVISHIESDQNGMKMTPDIFHGDPHQVVIDKHQTPQLTDFNTNIPDSTFEHL